MEKELKWLYEPRNDCLNPLNDCLDVCSDSLNFEMNVYRPGMTIKILIDLHDEGEKYNINSDRFSWLRENDWNDSMYICYDCLNLEMTV